MAEKEKQPAPVPEANKLPPEEADLGERIEGFNKELLPLLGKFELGLAGMPVITPDGRIVANPIVVSVRNQKGAAPAPTPAPDAGLAKAE